MSNDMGLTKAQNDLKRRITAAANKPNGFNYMCEDWDAKIWKWDTPKIYDYLEERFRLTDSEEEYYGVMCLLRNHLNAAELLVEWPESENRKRLAQSYIDDDDGRCNHLKDKQTTNRSKQKRTKTNKVKAARVKNIVPIQFIGDIQK